MNAALDKRRPRRAGHELATAMPRREEDLNELPDAIDSDMPEHRA
jgi:hypothetical protein